MLPRFISVSALITIVLAVLSFGGGSAFAQSPAITSLQPTAAPIGGSVTVSGSGFGGTQGSSTVKFHGISVTSVTTWGPSQLVVIVPAGATSGNVVVTVGGVASNGVNFTIAPAPTITSVSPSPASVGTSITIQGSNLTAGGSVQPQTWFYGSGCTYSNGITDFGSNTATNTSVITTVPKGAFSGNVVVVVDGVSSNALPLTITAPPLANAGPAQTVAQGSTVQLNGTRSQNLSGTRITYSWSLVSKPSGSAATLSDTTLPIPTFVADVAGNYTAQLIVNNGQQSSSPSTVVVSTQNSVPVANAGFSGTAKTGLVRLDGSASTDADGDPLTYSWSFVSKPSGSTATISQPTNPLTTFTADLPGNYVAQLIVNDGHSNSVPSTVTKSTVNSFPTADANAGPAQTIVAPQTVQLDGGGSTDIGGHPLSYSWSLLYAPPGSAATLSASSVVPTFQADVNGTYVAQLIVNDCGMNSINTVAISTSNLPPVAAAGPSQEIGVGSTVDLAGDGSTSSGSNALSFGWSLLSKPTGSTAALSWPTSEFPYFVIDKSGNYVAQLIVNNASNTNNAVLNSLPSTMIASTTGPLLPIANASANQIVPIGNTVQLSGADSISPDNSPLGYVWVILSKPSASHASLSGGTTAEAAFVADVAGLYVVQLSVHNDYGSGVPVTVEVTAQANQAPVVNAGPNQSITLPSNTATLQGAATDDGLPNGTLITSWSVVSGPGTVTFFNPNEAVTTAEFSGAGTYVLKLTANDSLLQSSATTTVTVNPSTFPPPTVSAGPNQTITLPQNVATMNGSATDNGLPLTYNWSSVSGPAPALFSNGSSTVSGVTTAMFSVAGVYDLRLTASNGQTSASADATITVNAQPNTPPSGTIVLTPASAGPILTGTAQQMQATVTNNAGGAIASQLVTFTVTGPNHTTGTATTNSSGIATFSYTGAKVGVDAVVATATVGSLPLTSNASMISWVQQSVGITTSSVQGLFYSSPHGSGTFDITNPKNNATAVFTQTLPSINFNPPVGSIPGMPNNFGVTTAPMQYIATDSSGNYVAPPVILGGNGLQAGVGSLATFEAVFLGSFTVAGPGTATFDFLNADGFVFGIGASGTNQPTRVSGTLVSPPGGTSPGTTAYNGYQVMGSFNSVTSPVQNQITVSFPAAGTYPYEIDYANSNQVALIPPGSTWKYQYANPVLNITSISRFSTTVTVTVNQAINNLVAGAYVAIANVAPINGTNQFPDGFYTVANPISKTSNTTTFTISNWGGSGTSSSGGTVTLVNPTAATISSIQGSTSTNTTTITVNQALGNFAKGTGVAIAAADSTDFPPTTQTVQQVTFDGLTSCGIISCPQTTFTVPNWSNTSANSSSGGTVSLQWNQPFYDVGFNDSGFSLGQAPFTNVVGGLGSHGCPFVGQSYLPPFGILNLRKIVDLPAIPSNVTSLQAWVAIDNDFTLWVNGNEVTNQNHENCSRYWNWGPTGSDSAPISIPSSFFVPGANLIAVQARDRGFDTGFDFALVGPSSMTPAKALTLVMSTNTNTGQSSVTLSPSANVSLDLGQPATFTALVTDQTGKPAANVLVTFDVAGANPQQSIVASNASGIASFAYTGIANGTDIVQASGQVGTAQDVSAQTQVSWSYLNNLPPSSTFLSLSPANPQNQTIGPNTCQTFTVTASNSSGPVANVPVTLLVSVVNVEQFTATTNGMGQAIFPSTPPCYGGSNIIPGTDTVEANAVINGTATFSNLNTVTWTPPQPITYIFTPQGWIGTPLIGQNVQNPVPIMLANGITLTSGTLSYYPASNPSNVTVMNSNTVGAGPLNLGIFDPTFLPNGEYVIQLQAISSTGAAQLNEIAVNVVGVYKPGRQVVTVTDFKVPIAGIPISISRNYDSLNRGTKETFGNGWSLGYDVNLQVDLQMNVTFTLDGNPETFYFTPQSAGNAFFPWMLVPHYTPQPGVHGTLTSNGCGILIYQNNTILQDASGVACFPGGSYYPTSYTYTDPVGRAYTITCFSSCTFVPNTPQLFSLQTIQDLKGNVLTFSSSGITSSAGGVGVTFTRDSQQRITKVTDPNNNNYLYSYDSPCGTGNLCTVTFPGTQTIQAQYTYLPDHSLNTQIDPIGNPTTYGYYSSANDGGNPSLDGRLQSVTTPLVAGPNNTQVQYTTQYSYCVTVMVPPTGGCLISNTANTTITTNPDNGVVTQVNDNYGKPVLITDALGHTTTYAYDSSENLITKTDSLGSAWTYTYDSLGNQTSAADPLGNTSTKTYNQFAEVVTSNDPLNQNPTTYTYDANFNLKTVTDTIGQVYAATYDTMGNPVTQTDANGNTTQLAYDKQGNLLKVVDPLNEVTTLTYDKMDRVLSRTDPRGNQTVNSYDALGNLTDMADPLGHVSRSTFDLNGNKTSDIDALGRTTSYAYDFLNRLVKITYPDTTTKTYIYDFRNNKLSETDQAGRTTQYQYDLAGELKSVTYAVGTADAGTVQYAYYANGFRQTVTDELNNATNYFYDPAGRLTSVTDAKNETTSFGYDADNRRTSVTDARGNKTTYAPDARGRLHIVTYPDTTTDQYTYDGVGNRKSKTDQANNVTQWSYDVVNRLSTVTDAITPAGVTKYGYDPSGNLTSITDANSHLTTFQYDALNRKALRGLPLGMTETFSYDAAGNLSAHTDFNGKNTTFTYDTLNRQLKKIPDASLSQPTITFTYNPTGTRATMADATGTTNYTYDNRDRLKIKATPEGTLNYTYDAHSNLLTILSSNTNGASLTYTPDQLNRLSTVTDNRMAAQGVATPITTYGYDPAGNMSGYTYSANGVQSTYNYDTLNRLSSMSWAKGTTSLSSFTYTPYPAGNVHTVAELSGRNVTYGYDKDYHLQSETIASDPGGNNGAESYTYDAVGNRKTLSSTIPTLPGSMSYTYDSNDRLTTDSYDSNGNTTISSGISFTYDFENRLLMKGAVINVYDGDGNRVSETAAGTTTSYLVDTLNPTGYSQVMDELVSGAVTRTYTYGRQRISENQLISGAWKPSFYGYDGHGNVRFLGNTAGTVTDTYQFDAFGNLIASTGTTSNPYLYSGERFDISLNLYHLRARYYNILTGRFETLDPWAGRVADPRTLHKYLYAAGNPINLIDPTGQSLGEEIIEAEETAEEAEEVKAYANKFTCIEDAFEQLEDLEFNLSYTDPGYGASSGKSLQALLNCAKKGLK